jgi:hypothetical protein
LPGRIAWSNGAAEPLKHQQITERTHGTEQETESGARALQPKIRNEPNDSE